MTPEFVVIGILGLVTLFAFILTVFFYIQQKKANYFSQRKKELASRNEDRTQGRFFKRYIPEALKDRYTVRQVTAESAERETRKVFRKVYLTFGVSAVVVLAIALWAQYRRTQVIDLTEQELQGLQAKHSAWEIERKGPKSSPSLWDLLRERSTVLVFDSNEVEKPGRELTRQTRDAWKGWLDAKKVASRSCSWVKVKNCVESHPEAVFIVLPGPWSAAGLDVLVANGAAMFLYGMPSGLGDGSAFTWKDLRFEAFEQKHVSSLALVGERPTTLGWESGQVLPLPPLDSRYRVLSKQFDGVAITYPFDLRGDFETRLYSQAFGESRVVWADFAVPPKNRESQEVTEQLLGSMFKFLLKQPERSIAAWPKGKRMGAFVSLEVENDYSGAETIRRHFVEAKAPLTLFVLSDLAQRNEAKLRKFAADHSVECFGDVHEKFSESSLKIQAERLMRCRKVLESLTGKEPRGFRPPDEEYDLATYDAMASTGYSYLFGGTHVDRAVPRSHVAEDGSHRVVEFGRMVADDFNLLKENRLSSSAVRSLVMSQMDWTGALGGLYGLSLHSQMAENELMKGLIGPLLTRLKVDDTYFSSIEDIAHWWEVRSRLLRGQTISAEERSRFVPYQVELLPNGQVVRAELKK